MTVTFFPSGHILGSSFIVLKAADKTILFTSDLGRDNHPILSVPDKPPASGIDAVVTESTYGDRVHDTSAESMAIAALELYRRAIAENSPEIRPGVSQQWSNQDPFDAGALKQLATTEESKSLKDQEGIGILIAASGMSSGGRVVHHLKNLLPDAKNTVISYG